MLRFHTKFPSSFAQVSEGMAGVQATTRDKQEMIRWCVTLPAYSQLVPESVLYLDWPTHEEQQHLVHYTDQASKSTSTCFQFLIALVMTHWHVGKTILMSGYFKMSAVVFSVVSCFIWRQHQLMRNREHQIEYFDITTTNPWVPSHLMIDQTVRAFGMNPKVGGSSPPQVATIFCLKNFETFT